MKEQKDGPMATIAEEIRAIRELRGLEQMSQAAEIGVSPTTLWRWESGAKVSVTALLLLRELALKFITADLEAAVARAYPGISLDDYSTWFSYPQYTFEKGEAGDLFFGLCLRRDDTVFRYSVDEGTWVTLKSGRQVKLTDCPLPRQEG